MLKIDMKTPSGATRTSFLVLVTALATFGCHRSGMSQTVPSTEPAPTGTFDLLVYGHDLDPGEHEVFLRSNLDYGAEWISLGTITNPAASADDPTWGTAIFTGLSTQRFLGQDFRESYLDLRITTADASDGSLVGAFYAVPHTGEAAEALPRITRMIETDPVAVERASIASHVQPSPVALEPGEAHVEHVRAPMTDRRPGVMEVLQLEVEWRNRDG